MYRKLVGGLVLLGTVLALSASAQEVLPTPPKPFKGQMGLSVKDSRSEYRCETPSNHPCS
jgi:hypothetical protein